MPSVILKAQEMVSERLDAYRLPVYDKRQTQMLDELLAIL